MTAGLALEPNSYSPQSKANPGLHPQACRAPLTHINTIHTAAKIHGAKQGWVQNRSPSCGIKGKQDRCGGGKHVTNPQ